MEAETSKRLTLEESEVARDVRKQSLSLLTLEERRNVGRVHVLTGEWVPASVPLHERDLVDLALGRKLERVVGRGRPVWREVTEVVLEHKVGRVELCSSLEVKEISGREDGASGDGGSRDELRGGEGEASERGSGGEHGRPN